MTHSDFSLAFYTGSGRLDDRIIRRVTRSRFSHVELVRHYGTDQCQSISASGRDGGVRIKEIDFDSGRWEILKLRNWVPEDAWARAEAKLGQPYDYRGILLSQAIPLRRHSEHKWFCSELIGEAVGFQMPQRYAPIDIWYAGQELNQAYMCALADVSGY